MMVLFNYMRCYFLTSLQGVRFLIQKLGYNVSPIDRNLHSDLDILLSNCEEVGAIFDVAADVGSFSNWFKKNHAEKAFVLLRPFHISPMP